MSRRKWAKLQKKALKEKVKSMKKERTLAGQVNFDAVGGQNSLQFFAAGFAFSTEVFDAMLVSVSYSFVCSLDHITTLFVFESHFRH